MHNPLQSSRENTLPLHPILAGNGKSKRRMLSKLFHKNDRCADSWLLDRSSSGICPFLSCLYYLVVDIKKCNGSFFFLFRLHDPHLKTYSHTVNFLYFVVKTVLHLWESSVLTGNSCLLTVSVGSADYEGLWAL